MTADAPGQPTTATDFPAMWEFVRGTKLEDHHYRCSWRTEAGALLCDCAVIWREYGRREERLRLAASRVDEYVRSIEEMQASDDYPARAALAPPEPAPSGLDAETQSLIRELAETVHQTGSLRDHSDPNDRTGWNVHGIETCEDPLCIEALAALRASTPGDEG